MKRLGLISVFTIFAVAMATSAFAQGTKSPVTGDWALGLQGDHVVPVALVITADGAALKAVLTMQKTEVPMTGEFVNGTLTLTNPNAKLGNHGGTSGTPGLTLTAKVTENGTLAGELSSGSMSHKFTGERLAGLHTAPTPTGARNIAGAWDLSVVRPDQTMALAMTLKLDGETLWGTVQSEHLGTTRLNGTYKNDVVEFQMTISHGDDHMSLNYTGKLNADGSLSGEISTKDGKMTWTAKRAK